MKIYFLVIATLLFINNSYGQDVPCGTETSKEYAESMKQSMPEFEVFKQEFIEKYSSRSFASKKNSVPIKIHIVRQASGFTSLDTSLLTKGINYMNKKFAGAGIEFYICGVYDYVNNTTYYDLDNTEFETLNSLYGVNNIINLYLVNSIIVSGSSAAGVAPTPGGSLWVMIRNNADSNVYAHEMGHFFGLLHTHGYSNTVTTNEFVDGTNSHEAGDYFYDTPADPKLSPAITTGANVNASCIYFGGLKDGHNQTYVPDATNIMSYAPSRCLSHFSLEQLAFINWVYINRRANLSCSSINVNFNSGTIISCDSPFVFHFLNESIGLTSYRWDINDDDINDYTSTNPTNTYTSAGIKWVSLSGTNGGKTYMRYKPIEFIRPNKVPYLTNFNSSNVLPSGWKSNNLDNGRNWEIFATIGIDGQMSNVLRFRNFNYIGYEEKDELITNSYDLRTFKNARISFDLAYAPHKVTDTLFIYASTDCGVSFPNLIAKYYGVSLQTHPKMYQEFIPSEEDWKKVIIPINTFINNYVRFKIVNHNMGGNDLYIDNFKVDGGDSTLNEIGFCTNSLTIKENNSGGKIGCRYYRDITIPVFISNIPSASITATVNLSGSASNIYDYEILNTSITFLAGQSNFENIIIRIWDDANSESTETIDLTLTIVGSTIYKTTLKNYKFNLSIIDNEPIIAENKVFSKTLLYENFNYQTTDTIPGWKGRYISTSANGAWFWDGYLLTRDNTLDSTHYMVYWQGGGTHSSRNALLETPIININEFDSICIELDQLYKVYLPYSGNIVVDAWNGSAWINLYTYNAFQGNIGKMYNPNHLKVAATGFSNNDFKIRFGIINDLGGFWYLVDNFKVTGFKTKAPVSINLNSNTSVYFGPNELVHIYDDSTGNIISSIQNLSTWDYGCTNISVDRAGNLAVPYMFIDSTYYCTSKTIHVLPSNNNLTGSYDISFYLKNNEMIGWQNKTNNISTDMLLVKTGGPISNITPTTPYANGMTNYMANNNSIQNYLLNDFKITGRFTQGFSGFAGAKDYTIPLPIELLSPLSVSFKEGAGNMVYWKTALEINCDVFEIEHSIDAINFNKIGIVKGQGNSTQTNSYQYTDNHYSSGINYYRFKQIDFNKKFFYSNIDYVYNYKENSNIETFPNPVINEVNILNNSYTNLSYIIRDSKGTQIKSGELENSSIDISFLDAGFYTIQFIDKTQNILQSSKIIKL